MASSWMPLSVEIDVNTVARIFYVDRMMTKSWNEVRREGELRLMCGWAWVSRDGRQQRQGFKSRSVCLRDAWYELVEGVRLPALERGSGVRVRVAA